MKKIYSYLFIAILATCMAGCSDDAKDPEINTDFVSFSIQEYPDAKTEVDMKNHIITVTVPSDVKNGDDLTPVFTLNEGAHVSINRKVIESGKEQLDFNGPVLMTVSNADYSQKQRWRINVTNNDYTAKYGLGNFLTYWWSNAGSDPAAFYFQQQHTGTYENDNCGPACAVMACKWLDPSFTGTVESARNYAITSSVDGGTWWYPRDIMNYIWDSVPTNSYWWDFTGASYQGYVNTIINHLENGEIAISCLNMGNVREQLDSKKGYRADCYYSGTLGHFLLIKGYRVVDGVVWFEVNDPWGMDLKYEDGTPYGASRFYRALEVATSIDWNIWTIMVCK